MARAAPPPAQPRPSCCERTFGGRPTHDGWQCVGAGIHGWPLAFERLATLAEPGDSSFAEPHPPPSVGVGPRGPALRRVGRRFTRRRRSVESGFEWRDHQRTPHRSDRSRTQFTSRGQIIGLGSRLLRGDGRGHLGHGSHHTVGCCDHASGQPRYRSQPPPVHAGRCLGGTGAHDPCSQRPSGCACRTRADVGAPLLGGRSGRNRDRARRGRQRSGCRPCLFSKRYRRRRLECRPQRHVPCPWRTGSGPSQGVASQLDRGRQRHPRPHRLSTRHARGRYAGVQGRAQ